MSQKWNSPIQVQLDNLHSFPAKDEWKLGEWIDQCHVRPEVANVASLPLTENQIGDARIALAEQGWYIWDGSAWQPMSIDAVSSVSGSGGTTGLTLSGGPTGTVTLTLGGTLNVGNGGTGRTTLATNAVVLGNGTDGVNTVAPGTNGNVLTSNGTTWESTTLPAAPVQSVSGAGGTTGLTLSGGPTGTVTLTLDGTLNVGSGGTGRTTLATNAVVLGNGTDGVNTVAPGANGNVLTSNGTTWQSTTLPIPAVNGTTNQVAYFNGATSVTSETNQFTWDPTNDVLGIGTATPSSTFRLDVQGRDIQVRTIRIGYGNNSIASNLCVGPSALGFITSGSQNVAVGEFACSKVTDKVGNTAVGRGAIEGLNGAANTALGNFALRGDPDVVGLGGVNVGVGALAGRNIQGTGTVLPSDWVLGLDGSVTDGSGNSFLGYAAGSEVVSGSLNVGIGAFAASGPPGESNYSGKGNVAVGANSLYAIISGDTNVAVGYNALLQNFSGTGSVGVGAAALLANNGDYAVAVGTLAGATVTNASGFTAVGYRAGRAVTTGSSNTALGADALGRANGAVTGQNNTAVGANALVSLQGVGAGNTAVGASALASLTTGTECLAVGAGALLSATGSGNVGVGPFALVNVTSGTGNVSLGASASALTTGANNTLVGIQANVHAAAATNCTVVGNEAVSSANNQIALGNNAVTTLRIGTFNPVAPATSGYGISGLGAKTAVRIAHDAAQSGAAYTAFYVANTVYGTITQGASANVVYNTTSDYRLKENIEQIPDPLERLAQLKPCRYNFIGHGDNKMEGFLAHELQEVVPYAVTGEKDAVDEEGNPDYQGVDQGYVVPLLTAALQKLMQEVDALKAEVAALKNA